MKKNHKIALIIISTLLTLIVGIGGMNSDLIKELFSHKNQVEDNKTSEVELNEQVKTLEIIEKEEIAAPLPKTMIYQKGNQVKVEVGENTTIFEICQSNIIRVNYLQNGLESEDTEVTGRTSFEPVDYTLDKSGNPVKITTESFVLEYDAAQYSLILKDLSGQIILTQEAQDPIKHESVTFKHTMDIPLYGVSGYDAWEDSDAMLLRQEGGEVEAGQQGDCGAPYIWTNKGFGILIDTDGGSFKNQEEILTYSGNSKVDLEYYLFVGEPISIQKSLFTITGTAPMFPKWSTGFTNSEWGMDQAELLANVKLYRDYELPLDNYTLDFDWKAWGEDNYGEFRWNNEKFPDGASGALAERLLKQGVKLTGIFKPRILTNTIEGEFASKQGYFWKNQEAYEEYFSKELANDIDFSNAQAGAWYFSHIKPAIATGIVGYWNDEADERFDNMQHMNMEKALYLGQRGYNDKRVWSINRNFYLGAQRYAYGMWSGDIDTGFESMKMQRERMLSAINLGEMKWGMDTGGFNGGNPTAENYGRWMQFSAFTPIFRVHGTFNTQRQPWMFGEDALAAARVAMTLRYQLIPYIYTYERQAYDSGIGLVKPLFYDYPNDEKLENYCDAWMFGDYLLVSPIVDKQQKTKEIYLPKGDWMNFWTGEIVKGEQTIQWKCDTNHYLDIPLFIKQGGIIPLTESMLYVDEKADTDWQVLMYPGNEVSTFELYDDDGESYNYESGIYWKKQLSMKGTDSDVEITLNENNGNYQTKLKSLTLKIFGEYQSCTFENQPIDIIKNTDQRGVFIEVTIPIDWVGTLSLKK